MTQIYIIDWFLGMLSGIFAYGVWKLYLEPTFQRKVRNKLDPVLLNIYKQIDSNLPSWLGNVSGSQLWQEIKHIITQESPTLTEEEVEEAAKIVVKDFSPIAAADALKDMGFVDAKNK